MPDEALADQIQLILDRETLQRFEKAIEAPLAPATADALDRLLAQRSPWET